MPFLSIFWSDFFSLFNSLNLFFIRIFCCCCCLTTFIQIHVIAVCLIDDVPQFAYWVFAFALPLSSSPFGACESAHASVCVSTSTIWYLILNTHHDSIIHQTIEAIYDLDQSFVNYNYLYYFILLFSQLPP